jgi:hypothetical protein
LAIASAGWPRDYRHGAGHAELAQRGAVSRGVQREFRHPAQDALEAMESALHQAAESLAARGVTAIVERIFDYAPIAFNPQCLARTEQAVAALGYSQNRWYPARGMTPVMSAKLPRRA